MRKLIIFTIFAYLLLAIYMPQNSFIAHADQAGTQQSPYPVHDGWQGAGYYYFPAHSNYQAGYVTNVCQLNAINVNLTGSNLGAPYDQNQIAQCTSRSSNNNNSQQSTSNQNAGSSTSPPTISVTDVISGLTVTLDGNIYATAVYPSGQKIAISTQDTTIRWGDGSASTTMQQCESNCSHTYSQSGSYTISILAIDDMGNTNTKTISVNVQQSSQQDQVTVTLQQPTINGLTVTLNGQVASSAGAKWSYSVNWGDGTINSGTSTHTYSASGTYTITVTGTDTNDVTGIATQTFTVQSTSSSTSSAGQNNYAPPPSNQYQILQICYTKQTLSDGSQTCSYKPLFLIRNPPNTQPETLEVCFNYCTMSTNTNPQTSGTSETSQYFSFCDSGPLLVTGPLWEMALLSALDVGCSANGVP